MTKLTAQQRAALRERGYIDGFHSRPKRSDHPEYLTSYRRGVEAKARGEGVTLRDLERDSIRAFVQKAADDGYLSGHVLDYGCGKQPYRDIVEAVGGEYHGYDQAEFSGNVSGDDVGDFDLPWAGSPWETILCTQVLQYDREPGGLLSIMFENYLSRGTHLVLTYPTNWPEVEPEDLHRFTKAGMERLLTEAGFEIVRHERRAEVYGIDNRKMIGDLFDDSFALGYGVIARA